jgi:hypothetical protein
MFDFQISTHIVANELSSNFESSASRMKDAETFAPFEHSIAVEDISRNPQHLVSGLLVPKSYQSCTRYFVHYLY